MKTRRMQNDQTSGNS